MRPSPQPAAKAERLPYQPPFDWEALLRFFQARAIPGVESVAAGVYRRTIELDGCRGVLEVSHVPEATQVILRAPATFSAWLPLLAGHTRRMFDLEAHPGRIAQHLAQDPRLQPLLQARPGLRLPGAWDGFEVAVRAILGQQVSVAAASTLSGRLVRAYGAPLDKPAPPGQPATAGLGWLFPPPAALAAASLAELGMPDRRRETIRGLARAVLAGAVDLSGASDLEQLVVSLTGLPGIGPWTAHYVALRLGSADAFPAGDLWLRRAFTLPGEPLFAEKKLVQLAEPWRPYRAYAALHLWNAGLARGPGLQN